MRTHVHMLLSIPPKYVVAEVGYMKGKSEMHIAWTYTGRDRNYVGCARSYFISTVGRGEQVIRVYIRHQWQAGRLIEQLNLV